MPATVALLSTLFALHGPTHFVLHHNAVPWFDKFMSNYRLPIQFDQTAIRPRPKFSWEFGLAEIPWYFGPNIQLKFFYNLA